MKIVILSGSTVGSKTSTAMTYLNEAISHQHEENSIF